MECIPSKTHPVLNPYLNIKSEGPDAGPVLAVGVIGQRTLDIVCLFNIECWI